MAEGRDTGEEEAEKVVVCKKDSTSLVFYVCQFQEKMRGFMHDVQNILQPYKKEKEGTSKVC